MSIAVSEFVKRQTPNSQFSHYDDCWNKLVFLVEAAWDKHQPGYRDGVVLVPVPPPRFLSAIAILEEGDELVGVFEARQDGEEPRKQTYVNKKKQQAKSCMIVLYHHDVLAENNEQSCDADWEIISINASPFDEDVEVPMAPSTILANHFQSSGGTATGWDAERLEAELKKSFKFWSNKALTRPYGQD